MTVKIELSEQDASRLLYLSRDVLRDREKTDYDYYRCVLTLIDSELAMLKRLAEQIEGQRK